MNYPNACFGGVYFSTKNELKTENVVETKEMLPGK
jgi:hypothetical protein